MGRAGVCRRPRWSNPATTLTAMRTIDLRGSRADGAGLLPRAPRDRVAEARAVAAEVCAAVRDRGDAAVAEYAARFDGLPAGTDHEVPADEAKAALAALPPALHEALTQAAAQVRWFHEHARPADWEAERDGARMGVRHRPVRRAGVYVPGGRAAYPSTVLMTVIPAQVAGVEEIVVCTPPGRDGTVNPTILAAAALVGADRVFRIGGAQAIAALAYGTQTVPRCPKVVGPGNLYVAEAKAHVAAEGVAGIDAFAGVTEVMVIADADAEPILVATSLVAQCEHDPLVTSILVTPSAELAAAVAPLVAAEVAATRHRERVQAALDGQGAVVLVDDLEHAVAVADAFGPEHLEIQTRGAAALAARVRAAGTVFVGAQTPTALGDYCAGPNHTLPTSGTARFTGGLSTSDFMVPVNWVEFGPAALVAMAPVVDALGTAEDLPAHIRSVQARLDCMVRPPGARGGRL